MSAVRTEEMHRGYADTSVGQMHYRESGEGQPIVLIHQALRSSLEWKRVMPHLVVSGRVLAIDLAGYGDSDMPEAPILVADHAKLVGEFVEALGLEPVVICGHHTGGNIALEFAAQHPDMTRAAVFSGPAVVMDMQEREQLVTKMSAIQYPAVQADGSHLLPIWLEGLTSSFDVPRLPSSDPDLLNDFFMEQIKVGPRRKEAHIAAFSHDAITRAADVDADSLVLVGVQDMWACARGRELADSLPSAALREFDCAGEMPRLEPELWSNTVAAFLAGLA